MNNKIVMVFGIIVFVLTAFITNRVLSKSNGGLLSPLSQNNQNANGNGDVVDNEPKTEECPINGALYSKNQRAKWEARRPMGIMIENHTEARPQSGLSSADVIYEAVAEGGITRFLSIFYCQDAKYVGPVRSARIYFIRMLQGYGDHPLYAHVGGANTTGPADALGEISDMGWANYNDLNQFSVPFPVFYRDYERLPGVATEHTVYSNTSKLWEYAKDKRGLTNKDEKGNSWDASFTPWKFQDDAAQDKRGDVSKISFNFWSQFASDFSVDWNYDKVTNSYARVNGGKPHIDKNTGKQLAAKNIVIVFADESVANDGYDKGQHLLYDVIGTGKGYVFQNGKELQVDWTKKNPEAMMTFTDQNGNGVSFVRGQIFVEILPTGNTVTFK